MWVTGQCLCPSYTARERAQQQFEWIWVRDFHAGRAHLTHTIWVFNFVPIQIELRKRFSICIALRLGIFPLDTCGQIGSACSSAVLHLSTSHRDQQEAEMSLWHAVHFQQQKSNHLVRKELQAHLFAHQQLLAGYTDHIKRHTHALLQLVLNNPQVWNLCQ